MTTASRSESGPVERSEPTAAQLAVLRQIHATATQAARMLDDSRHWWDTAGDLPPQSWFTAFTTIGEQGRDLEALAHAAGIPAPWIAHVRRTGERGIGWHPPRHWPDSATIDRAALIGALTSSAWQLRELAVAYAVYRDHPGHDPAVAARAREALTVTRERVSGLITVAGLTVAERERVWPTGDTTWAYTTADRLDTGDLDARAARCRAASVIDPGERRQLRLLDELDLPGNGPDPLPHPAQLVATALTALRSLRKPAEHLAKPPHTRPGPPHRCGHRHRPARDFRPRRLPTRGRTRTAVTRRHRPRGRDRSLTGLDSGAETTPAQHIP
ncbi:hypothetical protein [Nocardia mexicana]|uniref:Uncharacterized protein n=1 Tax=Nocardia mexicana TaxID=279262 RepID=A0A370GIK1_9NOCA|nr:hypothetical protein [Nocardia mexicana]RDI43575.1 hypothetical protein DFR68_12042 [Nocardia mexicana]